MLGAGGISTRDRVAAATREDEQPVEFNTYLMSDYITVYDQVPDVIQPSVTHTMVRLRSISLRTVLKSTLGNTPYVCPGVLLDNSILPPSPNRM